MAVNGAELGDAATSLEAVFGDVVGLNGATGFAGAAPFGASVSVLVGVGIGERTFEFTVVGLGLCSRPFAAAD